MFQWLAKTIPLLEPPSLKKKELRSTNSLITKKETRKINYLIQNHIQTKGICIILTICVI